jgi:hypothetical protein
MMVLSVLEVSNAKDQPTTTKIMMVLSVLEVNNAKDQPATKKS